MIDINYVEKELSEIDTNTLSSLHFWCEGLIARVRKLEKEETKYKLAIEAYKETVSDLQDEIQDAHGGYYKSI